MNFIKKSIYRLFIIGCIVMFFVINYSCKKEEPKVVKAYFVDYHLVIEKTIPKKKNTEEILLDELSDNNYEEYYNIYIKVNDYSKDANTFYEEFRKPYITNVVIEDLELYYIYNNNSKSLIGTITLDNYESYYDLYKEYNKDTTYSLIDFYDLVALPYIKNIEINNYEFIEYYSNGNTINRGIISLDNYIALYETYLKVYDYDKDIVSWYIENTNKNVIDNDFTYSVNNDKVAITSYKGNSKEVIVPDYYNGLIVNSISKNAFKNSLVESVKIGPLVDTLEANAFYFATKVKEVIMYSDNINIGNDAFSYCLALEQVILPNYLEVIPNNCFKECHNLYNIVVPSTVYSIGDEAFKSCKKLNDIALPSNLSSLGVKAFSGCELLSSVTTPQTLTSIPEQAYYGCTSLTTLKFLGNVTYIGSYCFSGCISLVDFTLPSTLVTLEGGAFEGCKSIKEVVFPLTLRAVGSSIFNGCSSLEKATINEGLTDLAASSFTNCPSLHTVILPSTLNFMSHTCFGKATSLKNIVLPYGLRAIYDGVFNGCSALEEINIPESVKSIGGSSFNGCKSLKELLIPNSVETINAGTLNGCSSLRKITIPFFGLNKTNQTTLKDIFSNIPSSLKHVVIGDECEIICNNAFNGCNMVETIEFSNSIKEISANGLTGLTSLKKIIYHGTKEEFSNILINETNYSIINNESLVIEYVNTTK